MKSIEQSNSSLLSNLLHLSRIVFFGALPFILHLEHMEYMRDFPPPKPGDPIVMLAPYPIQLDILTIAVIVIDLTVLWKLLNKREDYEVVAAFMFLVEVFLLSWMSGELHRIPYTPVMEKIVLLLGVLLFGLLQMLLIAKRRLMSGEK